MATVGPYTMQAPAISPLSNYAWSTGHWLSQAPPSQVSRSSPGHSQAIEPGQQYPVDLPPRLNFDKRGGPGSPMLLGTDLRTMSPKYACVRDTSWNLPTISTTHFLPDLPLTRSSQGWSSGRNSFRTMPYFFRRASSLSLRLNSLPAPDSGISSSW